MNLKMMGRFLAQIVALEAAFLVPAFAISLYFRESGAGKAFLLSMAVMALLAGILFLLCRGGDKFFGAKDGLVCVSIGWIVLSLLGALPFWLSREIPSFVDAFFETVSGFTTTGASILPEVERLSKSLLYWRSFTHWVGGMGVLVFLLAITPSTRKGGGFTMHLLRAESPGPDVGKLVPRMRKTASILYMLYIALTALDLLFLILGKMSLFDALCTAFGTAGTGGFGIKNDSMASYSPYIQNVCTVFMALFGVNFSCYYLLLLGNFRSVFKDEELRLYAGLFFGSILLISLNIHKMYPTVWETVRHAAFQVSSIMTTTGFATTDFDLWPVFSKTLLLVLMLIGACAGSTGGGLKCARLLLIFKSLRRSIRQVLHPQKVQVVRVNGKTVNEAVLESTNAYLAAYVLIIVLSTLVVSLDNFSILTNLSGVLACFNNIGPGLELVGPSCNFAGFSTLSKLVLCGDMLAGRLEIFPMLVLLSRSTWFKR